MFEIGRMSIFSSLSIISIIEMVGISPYPIKEEDFTYLNYFKSCGHQIIEICSSKQTNRASNRP